MRFLLAVSAAVCGLVLVAGCSSSAKSGTGKALTPSPTPATQAHLQTIVLQASDLPTGWTGTPYQPSSSDAADQAALVACVGGRNTEADKVAEANSDDYNLDNATISSSASSFKSQSDLAADIAILHSPKLDSCYEQLLKKELSTSLPAGTTIESATVTITPGAGGGPSNVVATGSGTIQVKSNAQTIPVYVDVAFITGPLIEAEVDAENVGTPVPPAVVSAMVGKVAARAAQG